MIPNIASWMCIEGTHIALDELGRPVGYVKSVGRVIGRYEDQRVSKVPLRPPRPHIADTLKYEQAQTQTIPLLREKNVIGR